MNTFDLHQRFGNHSLNPLISISVLLYAISIIHFNHHCISRLVCIFNIQTATIEKYGKPQFALEGYNPICPCRLNAQCLKWTVWRSLSPKSASNYESRTRQSRWFSVADNREYFRTFETFTFWILLERGAILHPESIWCLQWFMSRNL